LGEAGAQLCPVNSLGGSTKRGSHNEIEIKGEVSTTKVE
jgi:hypothetical protein